MVPPPAGSSLAGAVIVTAAGAVTLSEGVAIAAAAEDAGDSPGILESLFACIQYQATTTVRRAKPKAANKTWVARMGALATNVRPQPVRVGTEIFPS